MSEQLRAVNGSLGNHSGKLGDDLGRLRSDIGDVTEVVSSIALGRHS
jgi:hypothetical protein